MMQQARRLTCPNVHLPQPCLLSPACAQALGKSAQPAHREQQVRAREEGWGHDSRQASVRGWQRSWFLGLWDV